MTVQDELRRLPSVDVLLRSAEIQALVETHSHALTVEAIRCVLDDAVLKTRDPDAVVSRLRRMADWLSGQILHQEAVLVAEKRAVAALGGGS